MIEFVSIKLPFDCEDRQVTFAFFFDSYNLQAEMRGESSRAIFAQWIEVLGLILRYVWLLCSENLFQVDWSSDHLLPSGIFKKKKKKRRDWEAERATREEDLLETTNDCLSNSGIQLPLRWWWAHYHLLGTSLPPPPETCLTIPFNSKWRGNGNILFSISSCGQFNAL